MREIKFRGKRIDNGKWVYGWYVGSLTTRSAYIFNWDGLERTGSIAEYEVIPETVGEFTGLKDKNGKEIFEGDICKIQVKGLRGEFITDMRFFEKYSMFAFSTVPHYYVTQSEDKPMGSSGSSTSWKPFLPSSYKLIEVIGNIHENPELLTP